jgi:predicted transcriptional regulator
MADAEPEKKPEKKKRPLSDILFHKKPSAILILLLQKKESYPAILARESKQSYVYASALIERFEIEGLVSCTKEGKNLVVRLTEKGEAVAQALSAAMTLLD